MVKKNPFRRTDKEENMKIFAPKQFQVKYFNDHFILMIIFFEV